MEQIVTEAKNELLKRVKEANPDTDIKRIEEAFAMAHKAHSKQYRASGEPYILHPIAVADILTEMRMDSTSIVTALLHDTVEDTELTIDNINKHFGTEVAKLVDGVTKLEKIEYQPENIKQAENFRKLLLAISVDIRVLLVKLADRLHNMRTLHYISDAKKRHRLAHETMEIYAPLAERIGIHKLKNELQDLAFAELYPDVRKSITSRLEFLRQAGGGLVNVIEKEIGEELLKYGVDAQVSGREKTCCSIWYKMEHKDVTFEQISDIVAFRVIVNDVPSCYKALGIIHSKYHSVSDGFKDYISTPKSNGYQSIHTLIMGPEKRCIEVQIRTQYMHEVAELGVAAHWAYKQKIDQVTEGAKFRWVRELLDILESTQSPEEFLENTKLEMYYDQVFCFTPKGALIALPKGSTPVDFAFAIHSNIGLCCIGAKVNGRVVLLKTQLANGDQVEIICSKTPMPSPLWENSVVTGKAKAEIRKFIRDRQQHEYISLGRAMLAKEFMQNNREYDDQKLELLVGKFNCSSVDELLAAIGEGVVSRNEAIEMLNKLEGANKQKSVFSLANLNPIRFLEPREKHLMPIKGLIPGVALHFADCCGPVFGDDIVGLVDTGKGVTVHTSTCETLKDSTNNPGSVIEVTWGDEEIDGCYIGKLKLTIANEVGSLAELANAIAETAANVANLRILGRSGDLFELLVDVEVKNLTQLNRIISILRMLKSVHSVDRVRGQWI